MVEFHRFDAKRTDFVSIAQLKVRPEPVRPAHLIQLVHCTWVLLPHCQEIAQQRHHVVLLTLLRRGSPPPKTRGAEPSAATPHPPTANDCGICALRTYRSDLQLSCAQVLVRADVENADARGLVLRGRVLALSVHFGGFSEAWGRRNVHDLV